MDTAIKNTETITLYQYVFRFFKSTGKLFTFKPNNNKALYRLAEDKQEELVRNIENQIFENLPTKAEKFDKVQAQVLMSLIGMYETMKHLPDHLIEIKNIVAEYNDLIGSQTQDIVEIKKEVTSMSKEVAILQKDNKAMSEALLSLSYFIKNELPKIPQELKTIKQELAEIKSGIRTDSSNINKGITNLTNTTKDFAKQLPHLSQGVDKLEGLMNNIRTESEIKTNDLQSDIHHLTHISEEESKKTNTKLERILRIITFGTYHAKSAIKEDLSISNKLPKDLKKPIDNLTEYFIPEPDSNGFFNIHYRRKEIVPGSSFYHIYYADRNDIALFEIIDTNIITKKAIANENKYINPGCEIINAPHNATRKLETIRYGIACKDRGRWRVNKKAQIKAI